MVSPLKPNVRPLLQSTLEKNPIILFDSLYSPQVTKFGLNETLRKIIKPFQRILYRKQLQFASRTYRQSINKLVEENFRTSTLKQATEIPNAVKLELYFTNLKRKKTRPQVEKSQNTLNITQQASTVTFFDRLKGLGVPNQGKKKRSCFTFFGLSLDV